VGHGADPVTLPAMIVGTARTGDPNAPEIVPSDHCVARYRERMPIPVPGLDEVLAALLATLSDADITRWPPGWAVTDKPAPLWAISGDLAFPLAATPTPGRYLAVTCLRRGRDHHR
jgi:hypothetical protein